MQKFRCESSADYPCRTNKNKWHQHTHLLTHSEFTSAALVRWLKLSTCWQTAKYGHQSCISSFAHINMHSMTTVHAMTIMHITPIAHTALSLSLYVICINTAYASSEAWQCTECRTYIQILSVSHLRRDNCDKKECPAKLAYEFLLGNYLFVSQ